MRAARTQSFASVALRVCGTVVGVAWLGLALGCERKAPGPVECSAYADSFVRDARSRDEPLTPEVQSKIDAVTQLCLTTPYDRELISCAKNTGSARDCFDVYKLRMRQLQ